MKINLGRAFSGVRLETPVENQFSLSIFCSKFGKPLLKKNLVQTFFGVRLETPVKSKLSPSIFWRKGRLINAVIGDKFVSIGRFSSFHFFQATTTLIVFKTTNLSREAKKRQKTRIPCF